MSTTALGHERLTAATPTFEPAEARGAAARLRRAASIGGDVLLLGGVILCLPFAILAIGVPIALLVRLLVWIIRLV